MGISTKNKRKIIYTNETFYWWISDEFDGNGGMLSVSVATENKRFLVKYFVIQERIENRHIIVLGKEFPGIERKNGNWQRFRCPSLVNPSNGKGVTPKDIEVILTWCFDEKKELIEVDYRGSLIE